MTELIRESFLPKIPDSFVGDQRKWAEGLLACLQRQTRAAYDQQYHDDLIVKGPWVDVRAHGAARDGVTDATAAVHAARDDLASGGEVYLPPGTYLLDYLKLKNSIRFKGAGKDATVLLHGGSGSFVQSDDPTSTLEYASVRDLTLKAGANTDYLIYLTRSMRNSFKSLRLNGDKDGSGKATAKGIYLYGAAGAGVYYNTFSDTIVNYMGGNGVELLSAVAAYCNANFFPGLKTQHNGGDGVNLGRAQGNCFLGFSSESNGGYGVNLSHSTSFYNQFSGWVENNTTGSIVDSGGRNIFLVSVGQAPPDATLKKLYNVFFLNTDIYLNKSLYCLYNLTCERDAAGSTALGARVNGDAKARFLVTAGGSVLFGDGTNAQDVEVKRIASQTIGLGSNDVLDMDAGNNEFRLRDKTPASAGAAGTIGEICWDTSYVYVCIATDTWKRVAIDTW